MFEVEVAAPLEKNAARTSESPAVLILGPPWPRSGTGRVIQNQVDFYRSRGYFVVFIAVPIHCSFTEDHPDWDELKTGMREFGADETFYAHIDPKRFAIAKYTEMLKLHFRGTALDWIIFTAATARLSDKAYETIAKLNVVLVHINHVFTVEFTRKLLNGTVRSAPRVPVILETHDIQAYALTERDEMNDWTHQKDPVDDLMRTEITRLRNTAVLVHVSTDDLVFFKTRLPRAHHVLSMPTINEAFVSEVRSSPASPGERSDLLFVGHDTAPNAEAIVWLLEKVWPGLSGQGLQLKIVGSIAKTMHRAAPALYKTYANFFVGQVPDLIPYYSAARCVIAPMVSGTGISCKTIEALAIGKPFVGTSKAYRGMPMDALEQLGVRAYDTPEGFADAILYALQKEKDAGMASRSAYLKLFSNEISFAARDEAVKFAMSARGGRS